MKSCRYHNHPFFVSATMTVLLLLSGCGDSGPSRSEAAEALDNLAAQVAGMIGTKPTQKVDVRDLKCTKVSDGIYDCQVLARLNGAEVTDRYKFSKLGGRWSAMHIN